MPLPLPNLDTRRWADLVEEGRALIPRYAPQWTDHNIHDPGITLIELFAWLVEADIYRTNRVPLRHRSKFLQLIGFAPAPPRPARTVLSFTVKSGQKPMPLPAGLTLVSSQSGIQPPFRLLHDLTVVDTAIAAVQSFDGAIFVDHTQAHRGQFSFPLWGSNSVVPVPSDPQKQPSFYLGLSNALPMGQPVRLWLRFLSPGSNGVQDRRRLAEAQATQTACRPPFPVPRCPSMAEDPGYPDDPGASMPGISTVVPTTPLHHSIRTAWDYWDGSSWRTLDGALDQVTDETRGFTLDGPVTLTLPTLMGSERFGAVQDRFHYLRARLIAGQPDYLPAVSNVEINAMEVEQATTAHGTFVIRPGVLPTAGNDPLVGKTGHLRFELDKNDVVTKLAFAPDGDGPQVYVLAYEPAQASVPGTLTITLVLAGRGTGLPGLRVSLPGAPVVVDSTRVWTLSNGKQEEWNMRRDLDASGPTDAHFVLAATSGEITFGDGERARVVPLDAAILASFDMTFAANGNVPARVSWNLTNDDEINLTLSSKDPGTIANAFALITNPVSATGGADEESLEHAAGRALEVVWAHERLLDLCTASESRCSLDGLDRNTVLARTAPMRATTLIDYERLALDVPGAPIARARAWAGLDPGLPGLKATGTVVVVIVPWLPAKQPMASPALLETVLRHLDRSRLVGTRLIVAGPRYLVVTVRATLVVTAGARSERVLEDVRVALCSFLDPLNGGQNERGWPFGRDVYRSEILGVIDNVTGVDHVEKLELVGDANAPQCANLCVGPLMLVTPGKHVIEVAKKPAREGEPYVCT